MDTTLKLFRKDWLNNLTPEPKNGLLSLTTISVCAVVVVNRLKFFLFRLKRNLMGTVLSYVSSANVGFHMRVQFGKKL